MNTLFTPRPFTSANRQRAITEVLENTVPDRDFYLLVLGAVAFAICAIFTDSIATLIASMIVAPLAYPILGLALSIIAGDLRLAARSIGMLIISLIAAIALAWLATMAFGHVRVDPVMISFGGNLYIATIIALLAGAIAAYGLVRTKVGGAMTGIGIAVSLMPPLVATGIAIADGDSALASQAFTIFLLNVIGIMAASALVFGLFGLRKEYKS